MKVKKILIISSLIIISFIMGMLTTLKIIKVEMVNEAYNGQVTIKFFNRYIDYEYDYKEILRSYVVDLEENDDGTYTLTQLELSEEFEEVEE